MLRRVRRRKPFSAELDVSRAKKRIQTLGRGGRQCIRGVWGGCGGIEQGRKGAVPVAFGVVLARRRNVITRLLYA